MSNTGAEVTEFALPVDLPPMEAHLVEELPEEPGWQFEPKWDGFRCLAFRAGNEVELRAKSGKPLARYFPEMSAALRGFQVSRFVLDGELARISCDARAQYDLSLFVGVVARIGKGLQGIFDKIEHGATHLIGIER